MPAAAAVNAPAVSRLRRVQKMVFRPPPPPPPKIRRVDGVRNLAFKATKTKHAVDLADLTAADRAFADDLADDFGSVACAGEGDEAEWDACDESFLSAAADDDDASFRSLLALYCCAAPAETSLPAQLQTASTVGRQRSLKAKLGQALARFGRGADGECSASPSYADIPASLSGLIDAVLAEAEHPTAECSVPPSVSASLSLLLDHLISELVPARPAAAGSSTLAQLPSSLSTLLDGAIDDVFNFDFDLARAPSPVDSRDGSDTETIRPPSPQPSLLATSVAAPAPKADRASPQHRALGCGLPDSVRLRLDARE